MIHAHMIPRGRTAAKVQNKTHSSSRGPGVLCQLLLLVWSRGTDDGRCEASNMSNVCAQEHGMAAETEKRGGITDAMVVDSESGGGSRQWQGVLARNGHKWRTGSVSVALQD